MIPLRIMCSVEGIFKTLHISVESSLGPDFFFFFLAAMHGMWDQIPDQGSNLCPVQWKNGFLTTGPPGKSLGPDFLLIPCGVEVLNSFS